MHPGREKVETEGERLASLPFGMNMSSLRYKEFLAMSSE
jgi:hypothetical protein